MPFILLKRPFVRKSDRLSVFYADFTESVVVL